MTTVRQTTTTTYDPSFVPQALPSSNGYARTTVTTTRRSPAEKKSFKQSLVGAYNKIYTKAERTWNEAVDDRFRRYFGFDFTEQLYGEFWGELWSANTLITASAYLSTHYICILAKIKDPQSRQKFPLKVVIPLRDITQIHRAIAVASTAGSGFPVIQAVTDPAVRADSVQLITRENQMHQFIRVTKYDEFLRTLNFLLNNSRSAIPPVAAGSGTYVSAVPQPVYAPALVKEGGVPHSTHTVPAGGYPSQM
eukprot:TRINITY_DN220_c0_g1_i1.p1 TRINITY_DN220_c0_g1~~TRINITY_DN220_c0_g1_i1.p1  ORF type:complete len:251 (-),score=84.91 TRINITY_DN220_c0_g1_i1:218-970(-)